MRLRQKRQRYNPGTPTLRCDPATVNAVVPFGQTAPSSTTLRTGGTILISNGSGGAIANPSASDGGAAEFDVSPTAATPAPYSLSVTWSGATLAALPRGVVTRTITITAAGATGSPVSIPVRIQVV